jgi:hypothetical protein
VIIAFQFFPSNNSSPKHTHLQKSFSTFFSTPSKTIETFPIRANCLSHLDGTLTIKGAFKVHDSISAHLNLKSDQWKPAILKHIQYSNGFFNYNKDAIKDFKFYLMGDPIISDVVEHSTVYGRDLIIDKNVSENFSLYPNDLFKKKKINANDKATTISYTAKVPVIKCADKSRDDSKIRLLLPTDPYLAYWFVPSEKRRDIGYAGTSAIINPCADAEMADLKFPSMYWYVWNPEAYGHARDAKDFKCKNLLKTGRDYQEIQATFTETKKTPLDLNFSALIQKKAWNIKIIFGFLDSHRFNKTDDIEAILTSNKDLRIIAAKYLEPKILAVNKAMEPSVWALLETIKSLASFAEFTKMNVRPEEGHFIIELAGTLKESLAPFNIEIFLGPTSQGAKALHWKFLSKALKSSDMIFYIGHSGMGANVNLEAMKDALKMSETEFSHLFQKPYQLFSITGCFSTNYYSTEYMLARKKEGTISDLILTGSREYLFFMPLQILAYLDLVKAKRPTSLINTLSFGLKKNEIVTMDRN